MCASRPRSAQSTSRFSRDRCDLVYLAHLPAVGYINEFEFIDDHRAGKIVVELNGRINKCGVISPRYDLSHTDVEDWVGRLLPSRLVRSLLSPTLGSSKVLCTG
jgi:ribosomal protein S8